MGQTFYCWDPSEPRRTAKQVVATAAEDAAYQFAMAEHDGEEVMAMGVAVAASAQAEPELFMARITVQIDCEVERPTGTRLANMRAALKAAK
jgi:hypothetical protein